MTISAEADIPGIGIIRFLPRSGKAARNAKLSNIYVCSIFALNPGPRIIRTQHFLTVLSTTTVGAATSAMGLATYLLTVSLLQLLLWRAVGDRTVVDASYFDYVVVGAGSAGCVLGNRLSEDPNVRLLLLEAGHDTRNPLVHPPGAAPMLFDSEIEWGLRSEPQAALDGRRMHLVRGKALGGTSALNFCLYVRGNRGDYDHWAQLGNRGWGYDDILPYFRKAESNAVHEDAWHGSDGPLCVEDWRDRHPLHEMYLAALEDLGVPRNPDFNGERQEGSGFYQGTLRNGMRFSASAAYLAGALARPNVTVVTGAHATGLVIEGGRCLGVDFAVGRTAKRALASCETILSAGAIASPHLLLLSGIGPAEEIGALGIHPVADLPGVGRNLLDHVAGPWMFMAARDAACVGFDQPDVAEAERRFEESRTGPLSSLIDIGAFVRMRPSDAEPSAQYMAALTSRERFRHTIPPRFWRDWLRQPPAKPGDRDACHREPVRSAGDRSVLLRSPRRSGAPYRDCRVQPRGARA